MNRLNHFFPELPELCPMMLAGQEDAFQRRKRVGYFPDFFHKHLWCRFSGNCNMCRPLPMVCCDYSLPINNGGESSSFAQSNTSVVLLPTHNLAGVEEILGNKAKAIKKILIAELTGGEEIYVIRDSSKLMIVGNSNHVLSIKNKLAVSNDTAVIKPLSAEEYKAISKCSPEYSLVKIANFVAQAVENLSLSNNPFAIAAMVFDIFNVDPDLYSIAGVDNRIRNLDKEVLAGKQQLNSSLFVEQKGRYFNGRTTNNGDDFFITIPLLNVMGFLFAHGILSNRKNAQKDLVQQLCFWKLNVDVTTKHVGRICHLSRTKEIVYAPEGEQCFSSDMHSAMRWYCKLYSSERLPLITVCRKTTNTKNKSAKHLGNSNNKIDKNMIMSYFSVKTNRRYINKVDKSKRRSFLQLHTGDLSLVAVKRDQEIIYSSNFSYMNIEDPRTKILSVRKKKKQFPVKRLATVAV